MPALPILLVVVGSLSVVSGVAVPIRTLPSAPAAIATGDVSLLNPVVLAGAGLCLGGTAVLVLGTLLLSCEELL
jgi:hypothetical protein